MQRATECIRFLEQLVDSTSSNFHSSKFTVRCQTAQGRGRGAYLGSVSQLAPEHGADRANRTENAENVIIVNLVICGESAQVLTVVAHREYLPSLAVPAPAMAHTSHQSMVQYLLSSRVNEHVPHSRMREPLHGPARPVDVSINNWGLRRWPRFPCIACDERSLPGTREPPLRRSETARPEFHRPGTAGFLQRLRTYTGQILRRSVGRSARPSVRAPQAEFGMSPEGGTRRRYARRQAGIRRPRPEEEFDFHDTTTTTRTTRGTSGEYGGARALGGECEGFRCGDGKPKPQTKRKEKAV